MKSVVNALLSDTKLLDTFNPYLDAQFFDGNHVYINIIEIASMYNKQYHTRIHKNILIEHLLERSKTNKPLSAMFVESTPNDFVTDVLTTPYDINYIQDRISLELKNSYAFRFMETALRRKEKDPMFNVFDYTYTELAKLQTKFDSLIHTRETVVLSDLTLKEIELSCDNMYSHESLIFTKLPTFDKYKMYLDKDNAELGLVIAPPSKGKTAMLSYLASKACMRGQNVLYFEGETAKKIMVRRHAQTMTGMTVDNIASREYAEYISNQLIGMKRTGGLYVLEMFRYGEFTVRDIEASIINYIETYNCKPDCIFLDYADLLKPIEYIAEFRLKLRQIFIELKAMCTKWKVACWTASQTNRGGMQTSLIDMENVAEDFSKNMIIDKAFSLNKPKHKNSMDLFLYIVKNRDGCFDKLIKVEADFSRMTITEVEEICDILAWKEANKPVQEEKEKKGSKK